MLCIEVAVHAKNGSGESELVPRSFSTEILSLNLSRLVCVPELTTFPNAAFALLGAFIAAFIYTCTMARQGPI